MNKKVSYIVPASNELRNELFNVPRIESLYSRITGYIDDAHQNIQRSIDTEIIKAYWLIGYEIVEEEQQGHSRAQYGKALLQSLAKKLQAKYKRGFGIDTLEQARKFYLTYPLEITTKKSDAVRRKLDVPLFDPKLSWSHYRELIRGYCQLIYFGVKTFQNSPLFHFLGANRL